MALTHAEAGGQSITFTGKRPEGEGVVLSFEHHGLSEKVIKDILGVLGRSLREAHATAKTFEGWLDTSQQAPRAHHGYVDRTIEGFVRAFQRILDGEDPTVHMTARDTQPRRGERRKRRR